MQGSLDDGIFTLCRFVCVWVAKYSLCYNVDCMYQFNYCSYDYVIAYPLTIVAHCPLSFLPTVAALIGIDCDLCTRIFSDMLFSIFPVKQLIARMTIMQRIRYFHLII